MLFECFKKAARSHQCFSFMMFMASAARWVMKRSLTPKCPCRVCSMFSFLFASAVSTFSFAPPQRPWIYQISQITGRRYLHPWLDDMGSFKFSTSNRGCFCWRNVFSCLGSDSPFSQKGNCNFDRYHSNTYIQNYFGNRTWES
mmetsp:Transcript_24382/g.32363  ORF Transcript_24382/g.32363 Transcript_24382/m.32363 type:complete len:143 (-) Transcript_24382:371-799(-)